MSQVTGLTGWRENYNEIMEICERAIMGLWDLEAAHFRYFMSNLIHNARRVWSLQTPPKHIKVFSKVLLQKNGYVGKAC